MKCRLYFYHDHMSFMFSQRIYALRINEVINVFIHPKIQFLKALYLHTNSQPIKSIKNLLLLMVNGTKIL